MFLPLGAYFSSFLDKVQSRSFKYIEVLYLGIIYSREIRADSEILAPITAPVGVNIISRYFPKRLELSLMAVHAFPKASTRELTCRIFSLKVWLSACAKQRTVQWSLQKHYSSRVATHPFPSIKITFIFLGKNSIREISINHQHCFLR